ncbi:type VI secretion system tip protein TssI/VgrG [Pseudomonadota bacterium AL_CKDN230030165-1A_HGKHYDSX7]
MNALPSNAPAYSSLNIATLSQQARLLRVSTPLDAELVPEHMTLREGVSSLFALTLDCLAGSAELDVASLLGKEITVSLLQADGALRRWHAVVEGVDALGADGGLARYRLHAAPWLAALGMRRDSFIYQDLTVQDIVSEVLADYPLAAFSFDLSETLKPRAVCTQYRESDLAFVTRILAEAGLSWRFDHQQDDGAASGGARHRLVIFDAGSARPDLQPATLRFHRSDATETEDSITHFGARQTVRANSVARAAWNERTLTAHAAQASSQTQVESLPDLEDYDYAGHGRYPDDEAAEQGAARALRALESTFVQFEGAGTARALAPGYVFALSQHERYARGGGSAGIDELGGNRYALLEVVHEATNNLGAQAAQVLDTPDMERGTYRNRFTALPESAAFMPLWLPRPTAPEGLAAVVVSASDAPITTDRDLRVKVQFPWQRGERPLPGGLPHRAHGDSEGNATGDERSGTWLRVAGAQAGPNWGANHLPRSGTEVIVEFIDGDIDQPVVAGQLYNDSDLPPWTAGENAETNHAGVLSGWHSQGLDGAGRNQWLFDDTQGKLRTRLASSTAASQLGLGYLIEQELDDAGRGAWRGNGFELRSDAWTVVRSGQGMLISATARAQAASTQADAREAFLLLRGAQDASRRLNDSATQHKARPLEAAAGYEDLLKALDPEQDGRYDANVNGQQAGKAANGQRTDDSAVERIGGPHLLVDAPNSLNLATPASAVLHAGEHLHATAQSDAHVAAHKTYSAVAAKSASIFTQSGPLRAISAQAPVSLHAHTDILEALAGQDITVTSSVEGIEILGQQRVTLQAAGGAVVLDGADIIFKGPGLFSVKGATHNFVGPASDNATLPMLPSTNVDDPLIVNAELVHKDGKMAAAAKRAATALAAGPGGGAAASGMADTLGGIGDAAKNAAGQLSQLAGKANQLASLAKNPMSALSSAPSLLGGINPAAGGLMDKAKGAMSMAKNAMGMAQQAQAMIANPMSALPTATKLLGSVAPGAVAMVGKATELAGTAQQAAALIKNPVAALPAATDMLGKALPDSAAPMIGKLSGGMTAGANAVMGSGLAGGAGAGAAPTFAPTAGGGLFGGSAGGAGAAAGASTASSSVAAGAVPSAGATAAVSGGAAAPDASGVTASGGMSSSPATTADAGSASAASAAQAPNANTTAGAPASAGGAAGAGAAQASHADTAAATPASAGASSAAAGATGSNTVASGNASGAASQGAAAAPATNNVATAAPAGSSLPAAGATATPGAAVPAAASAASSTSAAVAGAGTASAAGLAAGAATGAPSIASAGIPGAASTAGLGAASAGVLPPGAPAAAAIPGLATGLHADLPASSTLSGAATGAPELGALASGTPGIGMATTPGFAGAGNALSAQGLGTPEFTAATFAPGEDAKAFAQNVPASASPALHSLADASAPLAQNTTAAAAASAGTQSAADFASTVSQTPVSLPIDSMAGGASTAASWAPSPPTASPLLTADTGTVAAPGAIDPTQAAVALGAVAHVARRTAHMGSRADSQDAAPDRDADAASFERAHLATTSAAAHGRSDASFIERAVDAAMRAESSDRDASLSKPATTHEAALQKTDAAPAGDTTETLVRTASAALYAGALAASAHGNARSAAPRILDALAASAATASAAAAPAAAAPAAAADTARASVNGPARDAHGAAGEGSPSAHDARSDHDSGMTRSESASAPNGAAASEGQAGDATPAHNTVTRDTHNGDRREAIDTAARIAALAAGASAVLHAASAAASDASQAAEQATRARDALDGANAALGRTGTLGEGVTGAASQVSSNASIPADATSAAQAANQAGATISPAIGQGNAADLLRAGSSSHAGAEGAASGAWSEGIGATASTPAASVPGGGDIATGGIADASPSIGTPPLSSPGVLSGSDSPLPQGGGLPGVDTNGVDTSGATMPGVTTPGGIGGAAGGVGGVIGAGTATAAGSSAGTTAAGGAATTGAAAGSSAGVGAGATAGASTGTGSMAGTAPAAGGAAAGTPATAGTTTAPVGANGTNPVAGSASDGANAANGTAATGAGNATGASAGTPAHPATGAAPGSTATAADAPAGAATVAGTPAGTATAGAAPAGAATPAPGAGLGNGGTPPIAAGATTPPGSPDTVLGGETARAAGVAGSTPATSATDLSAVSAASSAGTATAAVSGATAGASAASSAGGLAAIASHAGTASTVLGGVSTLATAGISASVAAAIPPVMNQALAAVGNQAGALGNAVNTLFSLPDVNQNNIPAVAGAILGMPGLANSSVPKVLTAILNSPTISTEVLPRVADVLMKIPGVADSPLPQITRDVLGTLGIGTNARVPGEGGMGDATRSGGSGVPSVSTYQGRMSGAKLQYVNLEEVDDKWNDGVALTTTERQSRKPRIHVEFNRPGAHRFTITVKPDPGNIAYSGRERGRRPSYQDPHTNPRPYTTKADGTFIVDDIELPAAGRNVYLFEVRDERGQLIKTERVETARRLYVQEVMCLSRNPAPHLHDVTPVTAELAIHGIDMVQLPRRSFRGRSSVDAADSVEGQQAIMRQVNGAYASSEGRVREPYTLVVCHVDRLAVSGLSGDMRMPVPAGPGGRNMDVPVLNDDRTWARLWLDYEEGEDWLIHARYIYTDASGVERTVTIPRELMTPIRDTVPGDCSAVKVDLTRLFPTPVRGTLNIQFRVVAASYAGLAITDTNLLFVSTLDGFEPNSQAYLTETLAHEMGHLLGMVPSGPDWSGLASIDSSADMSKLDPPPQFYYNHGGHCYYGLPNRNGEYSSEIGQCVMYGITCANIHFCPGCAKAMRKVDCSEGWPSFSTLL